MTGLTTSVCSVALIAESNVANNRIEQEQPEDASSKSNPKNSASRNALQFQ